MVDDDVALMAHLLRRAGFGAPYREIRRRAALGYQVTVEELLSPEKQPGIQEDLLMRYHPDTNLAGNIETDVKDWVYRMINNPRQLQEKMTLLWHMIFCAGQSKIDSGFEMMTMVSMFRRHGMGNFRDLLIQLSASPGMIFYLDNSESHKVAVNENYGRELLELFSMGVGKDEEFNYTEDDVKVCARAFTGWNIAPAYPPFPYGRSPWQFRYDRADHDDVEKTFLGETGRWNGEDVIDIICKQPATARFISRCLYNFFVADEPPVPSWRLIPPQDLEAIKVLEQAYFNSGYEIKPMLRTLFTSDFFKSKAVRYAKVKSPAELVAGTVRLVGEYREIKPGLLEVSQAPKYMGMDLMNPPTVEGWYTGHEWIDSGTLVERVNFASQYLGNTELPEIKASTAWLMGLGDTLTPEAFVDGCLEVIGPLTVAEKTRTELVAHARHGGALRHNTAEGPSDFIRRSGEMFQLIAASAEFQFG